MTWLLLAWGAVKNGTTAAFSWIGRNPLLALVIGLCCLSAWLWHGRSTARDELAQHIAAEKAATGAQKRVNAAAETHYKEVANVADTKHDDMVAEAFDATARFIQSRRVQPEGGACKAPAPTADQDPGVPAEVPTGVVVDQADVHACADLYAYSVSALDWAQSLKLPDNLIPEGPRCWRKL
jgi:hypothetical protein